MSTGVVLVVLVVLVVVIFAIAVVVGVQLARALRYRRSSTLERTALSQITLVHYTSDATATVLDQGDGTVQLRPRGGCAGRLAELLHRNIAGFFIRDCGAVYFYWNTPPVNVMHSTGTASKP